MSELATLDPASLEGLDAPFVKTLAALVRAEDRYGAWEGKSDAEVLSEFIVDKEKRKTIPIIGDPDPDIISRIEWYYGAVALSVEKATGIMASPMVKMSHEGFGRVVVTAGRLLIVNRHLRDVHRFGFLSFGKLAVEGEKVVADACAWIALHRDVAEA